jgi:hypothetical protein
MPLRRSLRGLHDFKVCKFGTRDTSKKISRELPGDGGYWIMEKETETVNCLLREIAMWEFDYRNKHVYSKSDADLISEGWERDCEGEWCHPKLEKEKLKIFRERMNLVMLRVVGKESWELE